MKKYLPILFTVAYVICEVIYNLGLVEFLTSKNTEITTFEHLETFGKTLSSIGLSLVLIHLFKNSTTKKLAFLILVPALYIAETVGFDSFVRNLSPETKAAGYMSAVYRNAVLNGTIKDAELAGQSAYDKVIMSNIMSVTSNKDQVQRAVRNLLNQAPQMDGMTQLFKNYQNLTSTIEPYYATYAIESKRWDGYKGMAKDAIDREFMKRTGGLKQGLNKKEFLEAVAVKAPDFQRFQDSVIIPGNDGLGIAELRGKDLPLGMSEVQFNEFVKSHLVDIQQKTAITPTNIDKLPHSFDLISSVFVPPLAIALSLMSIILNTGLLLSEIGKLAPAPSKTAARIGLGLVPASIAVLVFATFTHNPYKLGEPLNRATGLEATLFNTLQPAANLIHQVAIDDQHPNEANVIRIKAPEPLNFHDLEQMMAQLKNSSSLDLPQIDARVTADSDRIENDKSYFGEIKTSSNPYK